MALKSPPIRSRRPSPEGFRRGRGRNVKVQRLHGSIRLYGRLQTQPCSPSQVRLPEVGGLSTPEEDSQMFRRLQRSVEKLRRAALNPKIAGRIAGGLATGMVIGLLPKDSAIPYLLAIIATLLPHSLLAMLPSVLFFTLLSSSLDPSWDRVGHEILTASWFTSIGQTLESLPWMAWTRFNNTVVMGTLVTSLAAWLPVFVVSRFLIVRFQRMASTAQLDSAPLATEVEG